MRVVVERCVDAKCIVNQEVVGKCESGFLLLVGFTHGDSEKEVELVAKKIVGLRIFPDEVGKLNKSITDVGGSILAVSQFTLYADLKRGNRPSFVEAMKYDVAYALFNTFVLELKKYKIVVETGVFGADMAVKSTNCGPTTIIVDSSKL